MALASRHGESWQVPANPYVASSLSIASPLKYACRHAGAGISPLGRGSAGLAGAGMLGPGVYGGSMRGGSGGTRTISGILNMGHPLEGHPSAQGAKLYMHQAHSSTVLWSVTGYMSGSWGIGCLCSIPRASVLGICKKRKQKPEGLFPALWYVM